MNTLEAINKEWISKLEGIEIFTLPIGLVVSFLLAATEILELPVGAGITFLVSLTLAMLHYFCVYHFVKCPQCGINLSKFKNGKNIPMKRLYKEIFSGKPCRYCGWKP